MILNGVMALTLRHFTEFAYDVVVTKFMRLQCRRKKVYVGYLIS